MTDDESRPLADVDVESATAADVDVTDVRAAVEHDDPAVQREAVAACSAIAAEDLADVLPYVDAFAPLLAEENAATSLRAGGLLARVAEEYPEAFTDHVDLVLDLLDHDLGGQRMLGADVLAAVVVEDPGAARPYVDRIVAALAAADVDVDSDLSAAEHSMDAVEQQSVQEYESGEGQLRVNARSTLSNVLVAIVEEEPSGVADGVDDVASLLSNDDDVVVASALDALRAYAEYDPSLLAPYTDALVDCLDHGDRVVRTRAVRALGFAEADDAVADLRSVAAEDPEEAVRELAAETADFLESV